MPATTIVVSLSWWLTVCGQVIADGIRIAGTRLYQQDTPGSQQIEQQDTGHYLILHAGGEISKPQRPLTRGTSRLLTWCRRCAANDTYLTVGLI